MFLGNRAFCDINAIIYYTYIKNSDEARFDALAADERLPSPRRERIAAMTAPTARAQTAALTALAGEALARWGCENIPPADNTANISYHEGVGFCELAPCDCCRLPSAWPIGAHGKPFPDGVDTPRGRAYISLSHSGGHLVAAVASVSIGVDVQTATPAAQRDWQRLDARIRHKTESPSADVTAFLRRWAAKEAAVKCTGEGLSRPLNTLIVRDRGVYTVDGTPLGGLWQGEKNGAALALVFRVLPREV